jgi:hypothetical protein
VPLQRFLIKTTKLFYTAWSLTPAYAHGPWAMKRTQQQQNNNNNTRAPSPTPTAFSGISSYASQSYRPIRDKSISNTTPAVPNLDARVVARTHFDELSRYLAAYLARAPANSRSTARQKLTRLTKQQFQELSTDVYDELVRRKKNSSENEGMSFSVVLYIAIYLRSIV